MSTYENFNHDIISISASEIIGSVSLMKKLRNRLLEHSIHYVLDLMKLKVKMFHTLEQKESWENTKDFVH